MVDLDNVSTPSGEAEASISSSGNNNNQTTPPKPTKKKRNLPGMPDPEAEVIALSPTTLLATNRFVCEICNKGFQRDQNLQLHRRGHNLPWKLRQRSSKEVRKRVYVCPEPTCVHHDPSRALGDLTGIKKHFCRKHGEKKWKCDKCSKKYAVQSDWKAHSKVCGSREYKCDCGTVFSRRDSFITHRAFCDALAEENAKSQTQPVVKASSESDSKVLTGDSLPQPPPPLPLPPVVTSTTTVVTTPQSNSGVSVGSMDDQQILAALDRPAVVMPMKKRTISTMPVLRDKAPTTPYGLRQGSKLPSRYREEEVNSYSPTRTRSPKTKSPRKAVAHSISAAPSPARRALGKEETKVAKSEPYDPGYNTSYHEMINETNRGSQTPQVGSQSMSSSCSSASLYEQAVDAPPELESYEMAEELHASSSQSSFHSISGRKLTKHERDREALGERLGTKRLEHTLSLHKARRWTICEFFYSSMDEQLFCAENEFVNIVHEAFPNLTTTNLNKQQWRTIRRLLGKPRRCSQLFFLEEREALEQKRAKIRAIYDGSFFSHSGYDLSDLPHKIPRPLVVGNRVYSRIHSPKDGIYSGTIDAVLKNGYRIIFEKEDMIPPLEVNDTEVMLDGSVELVPISYFMEQVSAKMPYGLSRVFTVPLHVLERRSEFPPQKVIKKEHDVDGDKVGNFPVRMLVILVKLSKLIDLKKKMVKQLSELNSEAERANLLTDVYHPTFQEKYAQVVIDLENVNKQMSIYMQGVQEYSSQLATRLTENHIAMRPENLRKVCGQQAQVIVRQCNKGLNVKHPRPLSLITSLTSLLLQIRNLGQHKLTPVDLQSLSEAMTEIRSKVSSKNAACFQDHVEVHMKQIHNMMLQCGALSTNR